MNKILIITLLGISILFSCQENDKSYLPPKNDKVNENISKTADPHFDTIIAQMINSEFVFVNNIGTKISNWEDIINDSTSLNIHFSDYTINLEDGEYYLVGFDTSLTAISKIKLVLDSGNFYEREYPGATPLSASTGKSVTCSGCTSTGSGSAGECDPKENSNGWYCTDCSQGACTKSSTVTTGGFLSGCM